MLSLIFRKVLLPTLLKESHNLALCKTHLGELVPDFEIIVIACGK